MTEPETAPTKSDARTESHTLFVERITKTAVTPLI